MATKKVASAYVDLQLQTAQFKAAVGEAQNEMKKFSAQMRVETEKSRESVRLLSESIGLGIPRGLQNVIAKLPAVATAMNLAFDAVVVVALIHTVVEVSEKIVDFARKNEEAARKNAESWRGIEQTMRGTNNALQLANDKLADNIAKLEHKPTNGMKVAIDEALLSAQKLGDALTEDASKIADNLKQQQVGLLGRIVGNAGDADLTDRARSFQTTLENIEVQDASLDRSGLSKAEIDKQRQALSAQYRAAIASEVSWTTVELGKLSYLPDYAWDGTGRKTAVTGQTQRQNALTDYQAAVTTMGRFNNLTESNSSLTGRNDVLVAAKASRDDADSQNQKQVQAWTQQLEREKERYGMSVAQERAFWEGKLNAFRAGSAAYDSVQQKYFVVSEELSKQFEAIGKRAIPTAAPITDVFKLIVDQGEDVTRSGERWRQFNTELAKGDENFAEFTNKLGEEKIAIAEATGALTPHEAAIERAALHAEAYARALVVMQAQLAKIESDTSLTPDQRATQAKGVNNQISSLGYGNQLQTLADQQAVWSSSFGGAMDTAFDSLVRRSQDFNAQFKDLLSTTVNDINDSILKLLTEKNDQHPFQAAGKAIFTSVARTGLQDAEGGLLKVLGLGSGKPDGSHSNPIYTRDADKIVGGGAGSGFMGWANDSNFMSKLFGGRLFGPGGLFGGKAIPDGSNGALAKGLGMGVVHPQESGLPGILNTIGQLGVKFATAGMGGPSASGASGGSGSYADVQNAGDVGGFFNANGDYIPVPGMAGGGVMSPGDWYLTGEQGPELLQVGSTSRINNARDTAALFSGPTTTHNHNWHVDARGSNDPAAIHAAVQRGIAQAVPHLVAATKASSHDDKRRAPVRH